MNEKIINIIPAIRMLLSEKEAVITKFSVKEIADSNLLVNVSSKNANEIVATAQNKIAEYKKRNKKLPKSISINGFGTITVKESNDYKNVVANRIMIVTGGAQGFGGGIVEQLFERGANVVIADINTEKGQALADELNSKNQINKALFVSADISKDKSVENLVTETVKEFGGLDAFISNAGILRAGGLNEMTTSTFELMTKINYSAYFICSKYASAVMKTQNKYDNDHYMDIIQINSKSGLKGSNKNFAYAGGKFGGIGLTQSFALELMPFNIKVNSICPGNFFDGPLWADPKNGLFVQYLNAGKIPGAKTIDDVKTFYENQIPARRGCEVEDVLKAVCYAIEQKYETGQAIPVTGGQIMLS